MVLLRGRRSNHWPERLTAVRAGPAGMQQLLSQLKRQVVVVNLDPANDRLRYDCDVDVRDLVTLEAVQEEFGLGPNGGLLYCLDYLHANRDWLEERLRPFADAGGYFLFDCPGQVELFTSANSLKALVQHVAAAFHLRLACVHLVDAHLCTDAFKYLSAVLLSLGTMLHLELPHINVLSKMDLLDQYGAPEFDLRLYAEAQDLRRLVDAELDGPEGAGGGAGADPFARRFRRLSAGLCEVVEDFALVSFCTLAVEDQESVLEVTAAVDKATGYVAQGEEELAVLHGVEAGGGG